MKKTLLFIIIFLAIYKYPFAQIIYPKGGFLSSTLYSVAVKSMPEHGFLPGKQFPIYGTIDQYNFNNKKIKIILYDDRDSLELKNSDCSDVELTNSSEFKNEQGIVKVWEYINKLAIDSKLSIDKDSDDEYEIRLEALDTRLIGAGSIAAHGICQIKVKHDGNEKTYCTVIRDGDKNSPLKKSSFATRKTATRFMMSAAIRETIEKFLNDIPNP